MRAGDLITLVDTHPIRTHEEFTTVLRGLSENKVVKLRSERAGRVLEAEVLPERAVPLYGRLCTAGDIEACAGRLVEG